MSDSDAFVSTGPVRAERNAARTSCNRDDAHESLQSGPWQHLPLNGLNPLHSPGHLRGWFGDAAVFL